MNNDEQKKIEIEISPELTKGSYSNLAVISHSKSEFIIDFAAMLPGFPKAHVGNRIIMAPEHCKRLLFALKDNIEKYESTFGTISLGNEPKGTINLADIMQNNGSKS